jgi:hypothetical protein
MPFIIFSGDIATFRGSNVLECRNNVEEHR